MGAVRNSASDSSSESERTHKKAKRKKDKKKHKREHGERKEHKSHKHKRHKQAKPRESSPVSPAAAPPPLPAFWRDSAAAAAAAAAVADLVSAQPAGASGVSALLSTLDAGEALVLEHVPGPTLRSSLLSLCRALELETHPLPDGSTAHSKRPGQPPLNEAFSHLLQPNAHDSEAGKPAAAVLSEPAAVPAQPVVSGEPREPAAAGKPATGGAACGPAVASASAGASAVPRRVFGAAMPPPEVAAAMVEAATAGEGAEATLAEGGGDGVMEGEEEEEGLGPRPAPAGLTALLLQATAPSPWWKKSVDAPKPPPATPGAVGDTGREEWMTALPADRHGLVGGGVGGPRQFARESNQIFAGVPDASWTAAPKQEVGGVGGEGDAAVSAAAVGPSRPMSLAEAASLARANAASGRRVQPPSTRQAAGGGGGSDTTAAKSLVDVHAELQASEKKAKQGKAEWEGAHPWKPWNRETDLDIRAAKPKGVESMLKNQHMGELGSRFGGGARETTFM